MKVWPFLALLSLMGCSPVPRDPNLTTDDYVLVEFASKLEEDYQKNGGAALK